MKYFLFTIGLHNNDVGVWFDDVLVKGTDVPDHVNLIEDLDIDSEEDNSNDNDLKSGSRNKFLFQNFGFLSNQNLNCLFNHKAVSNNYYTYFPSLCGNSGPIYIFIRDLRI